MKMSMLSLTSAVLLVGAGAFATTAQAQQSFDYPQAYWALMPCSGAWTQTEALPVMT